VAGRSVWVDGECVALPDHPTTRLSGGIVRWLAEVPGPRAFLIGVSFLTVVPVPLPETVEASTLGQSVGYFPLVGALLGVGVAALDLGLRQVLAPELAAVFDLAALALLSGGLHLDALMDSCDGLFGGKTADERLAIMRDSRVGSFGVIAAVLVLLAEATALGHLAGVARLAALVLALALSRWGMALSLRAFPAARSSGLGRSFQAGVTWPTVVLAAVFAALVAVGLARLGGGLLWLGSTGLSLALGVLVTRRVGGLTGDSYGAIGQVIEAMVLVAMTRVRG
jgi:adenosylcobinamide-GDP ribazoletransferase